MTQVTSPCASFLEVRSLCEALQNKWSHEIVNNLYPWICCFVHYYVFLHLHCFPFSPDTKPCFNLELIIFIVQGYIKINPKTWISHVVEEQDYTTWGFSLLFCWYCWKTVVLWSLTSLCFSSLCWNAAWKRHIKGPLVERAMKKTTWTGRKLFIQRENRKQRWDREGILQPGLIEVTDSRRGRERQRTTPNTQCCQAAPVKQGC